MNSGNHIRLSVIKTGRMIVLTATRVDVVGRFRFRIEVDGVEHAATQDAVKAAKYLFDLGVDRPLQLVEHVREWGSVEIIEPPRRREYKNTG